MSNIEINEFSTMPELATAGWDPNACDASDYGTARAAALYEALGASPRDEEYALARHADGRLALIGLTVEGHKWASEKTAPVAPTRAKVVRISKSSRDHGAERAIFSGTLAECEERAEGLSADVYSSIGIRYSNENGSQLRIVST